jgi:hypothetical protein
MIKRAKLSKSSSGTDVLGHSTALAVNKTLGFPPELRYSESSPHFGSATLYQIKAIRICGKGELQSAVEKVTSPVAIDQTLQCPVDLKGASCLE